MFIHCDHCPAQFHEAEQTPDGWLVIEDADGLHFVCPVCVDERVREKLDTAR